jgi:hypothetical protein
MGPESFPVYERVPRMLCSRVKMACVALLLLFGCGSEQYEARLKETNAFFEYRQSLDRVLQPGSWNYPPYQISMRIPKGFNLLPPPKIAKEGEPVPEDTRQPLYLGLRLPGLVGAWQGEFPCDGGNRPVFLYVCSNHQSYLEQAKDPEITEPALFLTELENLLSATMQVQLPPGEVTQVGNNVRYAEICPRDGKYALQKKFTGVTFVPPGVLPQVGVEIKTQMYSHYNGPIHVAILAVYPASIRERLEDKLLTALETFSVSNQIPRAPVGKAGGAAGQGAVPNKGF